ncbi:MAG: glycosyltransferase [Eubacteriaceae bacterium]|jgi:glycosyltransferase involved in cell wall biosynthesis
MQHNLIINADLVEYTPDSDTTSINGWGIDAASAASLVPVTDEDLPVIEYKQFPRYDINDLFQVHRKNNFGFSLTLQGDWRDKIDQIYFRSSGDEPDTEYICSFPVPVKEEPSIRQRLKTGMKTAVKKVLRMPEPEPVPATPPDPYLLWCAEHPTAAPVASSENGPLFSIVTPVYNIDEKWLREFIDSVIAQSYQNWELCIADDCSTKPHVRKVLEEYSEKYPQIKVAYREKNGHISRATNTAIGLASGDFIAFMDNDDLLDPFALAHMASYVQAHPDAEFIYSDEDKIDEEGTRFDPFFKPDWNPVLLNYHNYITHFVAVKRDLACRSGLLNPDYNGAQDYDFVQRTARQAKEVGHIPEILYHWRAVRGSVAENPEAKMYAYEAGKKVLEDYLSSCHIPADVRIGENYGTYQIDYFPGKFPKVSVIIAGTHGSDGAMRAFAAGEVLSVTDYPDFEVVAVNCPVFTEDPRIRFIDDNANRSQAYLRNYAARKANGELLVFIDENLRPENKQWLKKMVNFARLPEVGICGPKILNNAFRVINAGVSVEHGHRYVPMVDQTDYDLGYYFRLDAPQDVFAVSLDCLMVRKAPFMENGCFDTGLASEEQDIDLSIRFRQQGLQTVFVPEAVMINDTNENGGGAELAGLLRKYPQDRLIDPYINPNVQPGGSAASFIDY